MDLQDQLALSKTLLNAEKGSLNEKIIYLETYKIQVLKDQPRKLFNNDSILELSKSIKNVGILQPLIVKDNFNGNFTLLAGERRWRAAQLAEMQKVPCIIKNVKDSKSYEIALIENIQREALHPLEEALAYQKLVDDFNYSHEKISDYVGKSRSQISNLTRLLSLPEAVKDDFKKGLITLGHAKILCSCAQNSSFQKIYSFVLEKSPTVKQLELFLKKIKRSENLSSPLSDSHKMSADLRYTCDLMKGQLGTRVKISGSQERGKIEIDYYTKEDLDRISQMILKT